MPSLISHAVVGFAAGSAYRRRFPTKWLLLATIFVSVIPDADVIGFAYGIKYADFLGHRGFFHSMAFSLMLATILAPLITYKSKTSIMQTLRVWLLLTLIGSSHGILDAMTSGGLGIALLAPFDNTRYFLPWTPITVSPIGIKAFMSEWGLRVLKSESAYILMPSLAFYTFSTMFIKNRIPEQFDPAHAKDIPNQDL